MRSVGNEIRRKYYETLATIHCIGIVRLRVRDANSRLHLPPLAEIHHSVLIAFGEILTFSGSLIGIDYKYRYKE